jgi:hypothetical protein
MSSGFYKNENNNMLYAPETVSGPYYFLNKDEFQNYTYPIDGWYYFNTENEAKDFFGLSNLEEQIQALKTSIIGVRISARQIRLWLVQNGIPLQAVTDAINAIEDPVLRDTISIEWEYAPYIERSHPMLVPLGLALGFTEQQIDHVFIEAVNI